VLLMTVIAYLAAASIVESRATDPTRVLPAPRGMFSHWMLWVLIAAFCVNLILVTALGCVVECGAMLFNWFAVNYLLGGLHSYA